nr:olfactory receptor 35 [Tropidothorax elegans]
MTTKEVFFDLRVVRIAGMIRIHKPLPLLLSFMVISVQVLGMVASFSKVFEQAQKEKPDMLVAIEALHWSLVNVCFMSGMVSMWIKTEEFMTLVSAIKSGIFTYSNGLDDYELGLLNGGSQEAHKYFRLFGLVVTVSCFVSMLRNPIFGEVINEEGSEVTRLTFYHLWFPFAINTWARYAGVCIFEFFVAQVVLFQGLGLFAVVTSTLIHISTSFKILESKISKAHIYAKIVSENDNKFEYHLYDQLKQCAKHHQMLIRCHLTFQKIYAPVFLMMCLNSGIIICGVGYMLTGPDSNLRSVLTFSFVIGAEMLYVGGICYFGERLSNTSEKLQDTVYNVPWYNQPKKMAVLYQMMLNRSSKPLLVSAYGINKALNLSTLADILQASYTYFNMLLAARK